MSNFRDPRKRPNPEPPPVGRETGRGASARLNRNLDVTVALLPPSLRRSFCDRHFYHGIRFRSRKNPPFGPLPASVASHTIVSAPSAQTHRTRPARPFAVCTQPGHAAFTFTSPRTSRASRSVRALSAAFEML